MGGTKGLTKTSGEITYSMGQIFQTTYLDDYKFQEGVHHPYEESISTDIFSLGNEIRIDVYPNPTAGIVHIITKNIANFSLQVFDQLGSLVCGFYNLNNNKTIDLGGYSSSFYFIKICDSRGQLINSIKLLKQ